MKTPNRLLLRHGRGVRTSAWRAAIIITSLLGLVAPLRAADAPTESAPAEAPAAITTADIKGVSTPSTDDLAKGDPGGALTGSAADIVMADAKKGLTLADVVSQVGQNRIAINFVWTLITGYLVMFMQAGFALVETGLGRAK